MFAGGPAARRRNCQSIHWLFEIPGVDKQSLLVLWIVGPIYDSLKRSRLLRLPPLFKTEENCTTELGSLRSLTFPVPVCLGQTFKLGSTGTIWVWTSTSIYTFLSLFTLLNLLFVVLPGALLPLSDGGGKEGASYVQRPEKEGSTGKRNTQDLAPSSAAHPLWKCRYHTHPWH